MISTAYAASGAAAGQEAFYDSPTFWVALSFVIFVLLLAKPMWKFVTAALDKKIDEIEASIEEAAKLREEAQDLLAGYKRKIADAEKEAEDIVNQARDEAQALKNRMTTDLEASLERREKLAIDRIAQAETDATTEVRAMTADIALAATRQLLIDNAKDAKADELIDGAIKELPEKLN
ncbi:MAG: F0F1 ATP synthase subunit B [Rhodospirillaceae bacterium]|jgi:F-type H+-transporting ATPase subunit b|nr:F0F1 ATP synthase subunit B [Rhodospirillaceae bacterium]